MPSPRTKRAKPSPAGQASGSGSNVMTWQAAEKLLNDPVHTAKYSRVRPGAKHGDALAPASAKDYINKAKQLTKWFKKNDLNEILQDCVAVKNHILNHRTRKGTAYGNESLKSWMSAIMSLIRYKVVSVSDHCAGQYSAIMMSTAAVSSERSKENVMSPDLQEAVKAGVTIESIQRDIDKLPHNSPKKLLLALLIFMEPRRLRDFYEMLIRLEGDGKPMPDGGNYLIVPADARKNLAMKISAYKTSKTLGTFVNDQVPKALSDMLRAYVASGVTDKGGKSWKDLEKEGRVYRQPKYADQLFVNTLGAPLAETSASEMVSGATKDITGFALSLNDIRHLYINENVRDKSLTIKEREHIARRMGHSLAMQDTYQGWTPEERAAIDEANAASRTRTGEASSPSANGASAPPPDAPEEPSEAPPAPTDAPPAVVESPPTASEIAAAFSVIRRLLLLGVDAVAQLENAAARAS